MAEEMIQEEAVEAPEFDHEAHMAKIAEGLQAILASQDINEIHQIAEALLAEEQGEAEVEGQGKMDFRAEALKAMQGGQ